jgi:oligosaccharide repeat unit polymerase
MLLGFICLIICNLKSRDIIHPIGIGSLLWFMAAALSNVTSLYDRSLQIPLSFETNLAIFLAGISFTIPVLFSRKINKDAFTFQKLYFGFGYKAFFNFFIVLSFLAFIIRFKSELLTPPLFYGTSFDLKQSVPDAVPGLNFADIAIPFLAIIAFWEYKNSINISSGRKLVLILYILFSVVSLLVYKVSRGEFIVIMLGIIYLIIIPKRIFIRLKYLLIVLFFASLFFYVGSLRISESSRVSTQFGSGSVNVLLSQIYTYIAMNFQNLNTLVNSNFEPTYFWGGFKFFLKPFFSSAYDGNDVGLTDYTTLFFNAKTFIYFFYNDLGLAGVVFYPLMIGLILQCLYNSSVQKVKYFVITACLMKPILFMFFGNYFFGEFVLLIPYFMISILALNVKTIYVKT